MWIVTWVIEQMFASYKTVIVNTEKKLVEKLVQPDMLPEMFDDQREFLDILINKGKLPQYPIDVHTKEGQQLLRNLLRDAEDELNEARLVLKNTKEHRSAIIDGFDREHFIEEIVDALKFCLGVLIYANVTIEEFFRAFKKKTRINKQRQKEGY